MKGAAPVDSSSFPNNTPNKQRRLKGKARKSAKESVVKLKVQEEIHSLNVPKTRYTITTKEVIEQAQAIAGRVELPHNVRKVLK